MKGKFYTKHLYSALIYGISLGMSIYNPHDKVFKEVESVKENALDMLQAFLPADISGLLDFSTLELDNQSYIDETLSTFFSDLVYSCRLRAGEGELRIAFLLEH